MKNKNLIIKIVFFIFSFILFQFCEYEKIEEVKELDINDTISFSKDIIPMFNNSCNASGCHNNGGIAPDLSAENAYIILTSSAYIDTANPDKSNLYLRMIDVGKPMPTTGLLPKTEALKVLNWIKQGVLEN